MSGERWGAIYGGLIIAIGVAVNFASWAFFYSYGVFIKPLSEALGSTRTEASITPMICLLVLSLSSPGVGMLLDKYPIRRIMLFFTVLMGSGLILLSQVQSAWQLYCIVGLMIGASVQGMGAMSTAKLLTNWFVEHRGFALGLSAIGFSAAGMAMPLLSVWLLAWVGWKMSYAIVGVAMLAVIFPLTAVFVRSRPEDIGLRCDFNSGAATTQQSVADAGGVLRAEQILRDSTFWKIALIIALPAGILMAMVTHTVPYVTDAGVSDAQAATVLSLIAAVAMFAKAGWGWLIDHTKPRLAIYLASVVQAVGVALFLYGESYLQFCVAACVYGLGMASIAPFQGVLIARAFGATSFATVFGYTIPATLPFTLGFIYLAAQIYDTLNGYEAAFWIFIALCGVVALIGSRLSLRQRE